MNITGAPHVIFRRHRELGWSLTPDRILNVPFREGVTQTIGADGQRIVTGRATEAAPRVNIYGCSWTYGTGLSDNETVASRLQTRFPVARFRNRGCGGYGTVQNYIQFQQDITAQDVDFALFLIISNHRFRNTPHPVRWRQFQSDRWAKYGVTHIPIARQGRDGAFRVAYVPIDQPFAEEAAVKTFLPSDYMLDQASFAVLDAISMRAEASGIPIAFAILDDLDPVFNRQLCERFDYARDISVPFDAEHFWLPYNNHPNAHSNEIFERGLTPQIETWLSMT